MTHRIPNRRWLDNPEHKVSQAQLKRVQQATKRSELPSESQRRGPPDKPQANNRHQNQ